MTGPHPRRRRAVTLGLLAGALCTPLLTGTATADQIDGGGGSTGSGYTVEVRIELSGEAAPGGGSVVEAYVAPECWWAPASPYYQDAKASLDWYDDVTGGLQTPGVIGRWGPRRVWEEAAESGDDLHWYHAICKDVANLERYDAGSVEGIDPGVDGGANFVTYYYRPFPAGTPVPDPLVDPEELARVARDNMVIPEPVTNRNPKIKSAGAPTLVGLPTWFWVEDDQAVGGDDGKRDITAELGQVSATVVAQTGGLNLNSPAGSVQCAPPKAMVEYATGASEASACTIAFERASVGYAAGYPLAASTNWAATWTSPDGDGGGLDPLVRAITTNVPVAEVQNIVTRR